MALKAVAEDNVALSCEYEKSRTLRNHRSTTWNGKVKAKGEGEEIPAKLGADKILHQRRWNEEYVN